MFEECSIPHMGKLVCCVVRFTLCMFFLVILELEVICVTCVLMILYLYTVNN